MFLQILGQLAPCSLDIPDDAHIISLKLKRKLQYKQAYMYDAVRPEKVITALHFLKQNNPLYSDIEINDDWITSWKEDGQEFYDAVFEDNENQLSSTAHHINKQTTENISSSSQILQHNTDTRKSKSFMQLENVAFQRGYQVVDVPGSGDKYVCCNY